MGTESIGTAALTLTVDTRGVDIGIDKSKSKLAGFSNAAQQEFQALDSATKKSVLSLERQASQLGMTRTEWLAYNATLKTSGAIQQELLTKINASNAAVKKGGIVFNEYGLSAKQTTAALRQVPAQLTDIFVGLQGGQNPLTVLIQQGGQLKDVFGGVAPAAKALGSAILGLVNPVTLTIGAIAGLIFILKSVEDREQALSNALILTGNAAEASVGQLQAYAKAVDDTTQASERSASEVVARVAETGKFVGDQILLVATAAEQMREATGREISKTVSEFASLKDGPVDAILKLNAAIGDGTNVTHFLTQETLDQIEALMKQGREAEATQLAFEAYAGAINTRAPTISQNLDTMAGKWRAIKDAAGDASDVVVDGVNKVLNALAKADDWNAQVQKRSQDWLKSQGGFLNAAGQIFDSVIADPAAAAKPRAAPKADSPIVDPAQRAAFEKFREQGLRFLTDEAKLEREIAEARRLATAAGIKDVTVINARVDAIKKEFADRAASKGKGAAADARNLANAEVKADLQSYKDALAVQQASIQSGTQLLQANYAARNVSAADYYAQQRGFLEQGTAAEEKALQGQIAILEQRNLKGKDAVDTVRQIAEMEAQLAKVRAEGSTKLALLTIQEQEYYQNRSNSIEDYRDRLLQSNAALQLQTNAVIARIGVGSQEAQQQERVNEIYAESAQRLSDLNKELRRGLIDQAQFDADSAALQSATDQQVQIVTDGFQQMLAAQADWHNGFQKGLADWLAGTADVATQISGITNRALDSAADAFVEFATTGKTSIKSLLASILTDIVRFLAKRAIMQFLEAFAGSFAGGGGGGASSYGGGVLGSGSAVSFNANGNPFPSGTTLPKNAVLSKPTLFKFAKGGSFGVAGEAGKEAVMPLQRGTDGKLGVRMYGGGGNQVSVHVETNIDNSGNASVTTRTDNDDDKNFRAFSERLRAMVHGEIRRSMSPGGDLYRAGAGAKV